MRYFYKKRGYGYQHWGISPRNRGAGTIAVKGTDALHSQLHTITHRLLVLLSIPLRCALTFSPSPFTIRGSITNQAQTTGILSPVRGEKQDKKSAQTETLCLIVAHYVMLCHNYVTVIAPCKFRNPKGFSKVGTISGHFF